MGVVRHGQVGEEIIALCQEIAADYLVLGRPRPADEEANVFTDARLASFVALVQEHSGARVVMLGGEEA